MFFGNRRATCFFFRYNLKSIPWLKMSFLTQQRTTLAPQFFSLFSFRVAAIQAPAWCDAARAQPGKLLELCKISITLGIEVSWQLTAMALWYFLVSLNNVRVPHYINALVCIIGIRHSRAVWLFNVLRLMFSEGSKRANARTHTWSSVVLIFFVMFADLLGNFQRQRSWIQARRLAQARWHQVE